MSTDPWPTVNIKPYRLSCVRLCARVLSDETASQWPSRKREDTGHAENCQVQQYAPSVSFVFPLTPPPWNARGTHLPLHCKVHAKSLRPKLGCWSFLVESGTFSASLWAGLCIVSGGYRHAECLARVHQRVTCAVSRAFSLAAGQPAQSVVGTAWAALFPLPLSCPLRQPGHARSTWLPRTRVQSAGLKTPLWRVPAWRINQLPAVTGAVCE